MVLLWWWVHEEEKQKKKCERIRETDRSEKEEEFRWRHIYRKTLKWSQRTHLKRFFRIGENFVVLSRILSDAFVSPLIFPSEAKPLPCVAQIRFFLIFFLFLFSCFVFTKKEYVICTIFMLCFPLFFPPQINTYKHEGGVNFSLMQEKLRVAVLVSKAAFQFIQGQYIYSSYSSSSL